MNPALERVDLIDLNDRVIGWALRRDVRARNLLHRGVGIICRNSSGDVYVHRRTTTKDVFPGLYDMFVGGVVGQGESYAVAAKREIGEELGIAGPEPVELFRHTYIGPRNRSLVAIFEVEWDGPIVHQQEEIDWGRFFTQQELDESLDSLDYVPDGLEIYYELKARRDKPQDRPESDRGRGRD
ncbi:MAG: NUDIX domain-containing protein [Planctomycetota bacterium]